MTSTLDDAPRLIHHTTLHAPTAGTRTWSSSAHPSSRSPLLATAASDRSVHIWDMRDWRLLSTIAGGHKRSIRCVGWKDFGQPSKKRKTEETLPEEPKPVILATGSFDANCGLWVWNGDKQQKESGAQAVPGAFEEEQEQDFTNAEEEEEDWHFSTLLTGPDSEIKDLAFSPPHYGANLLATSSRDKSVWVWEEVEPEEWETVAVLSEHTGDVKCVQWLSGARTTKRELRRRLRQKHSDGTEHVNGEHEDDDEEMILGQRELLASGSYDDTIRLHYDDETEGDWLTIAVLTGHDGTVWDLKFESYLSLVAYPTGISAEEVMVDWRPRLLSCSDDITIRLWQKVLTEKEKDERKLRLHEVRRGQGRTEEVTEAPAAPPIGFSGRIPSTIRPPTSSEKWQEVGRLPAVHVRSIYAVDWSSKTGLIVSCGGDGLIAIYQEVATPSDGSDVVMNGTDDEHGGEELSKLKTEWKIVASMEAAHDEYEINHVCWTPKRDVKHQDQLTNGADDIDNVEEYIVSTGDDGQVRVWRLPESLRHAV